MKLYYNPHRLIKYTFLKKRGYFNTNNFFQNVTINKYYNLEMLTKF